MIRETAGESALELAARRLERALAALEQRLTAEPKAQGGKGGAKAPGAASGDLFDEGEAQARLAAELERARVRERELEAAGAQASAALGRAIDEIRAALNGAAQPAER
jgi:hypothetical protein